MMTENADKKREQIHLLCMDEMVPRIIFFELSIKQSIGLSFMI